MITDAMYDLAIRELSERTDPAKEIREDAAKATRAAAARAESDDSESAVQEPPGPCCQT